MSRGVWTSRGFEFVISMNPDESQPKVVDALYFSLAAMRVLELAIHCASRLDPSLRDERAAAV